MNKEEFEHILLSLKTSIDLVSNPHSAYSNESVYTIRNQIRYIARALRKVEKLLSMVAEEIDDEK